MTVINDFIRANWIDGIQFEEVYSTSISESLDSKIEDRASLRSIPQRFLRFISTGMSLEETYRINLLAFEQSSGRTFCPLWQDRTWLVSDATGTTLNIKSSSYRRFFAGRKVCILYGTTLEYHDIDSVSLNTIELTTPLSGTIPKDSLVYPMIEVEINLNAGSGDTITDYNTEFQFALKESSFSNNSRLPANEGYFSFDTHTDGKYIFNPFNLGWNNGIEHSIFQKGSDQLIGRDSLVESRGDRPLNRFSLPIITLTRANAFYILDFFNTHKGRKKTFWFMNPTTLFDGAVIGSNYIEIPTTGLETLVEQNVKNIAFKEKQPGAIPQIFEVQNISEISGVYRITFTTSLPSFTTNPKISTAFLVRFEVDNIVENWDTDRFCSLELSVVEVLQEEDVTIATSAADYPLDIRVTSKNIQVVGVVTQELRVTQDNLQVLGKIPTMLRTTKYGVQVLGSPPDNTNVTAFNVQVLGIKT